MVQTLAIATPEPQVTFYSKMHEVMNQMISATLDGKEPIPAVLERTNASLKALLRQSDRFALAASIFLDTHASLRRRRVSGLLGTAAALALGSPLPAILLGLGTLTACTVSC